MTATLDPSTANESRPMVVVHMGDGQMIKGTVDWPLAPDQPFFLPQLPEVLDVFDESTGIVQSVRVAQAKAVFFVRSYEGNVWHEEVKFFTHGTACNLWIRVAMRDGEVLEGRIANNLNLLTEAGFWLWPTDKFANNKLIYIPKTSAVEFNVMALEVSRAQVMADFADETCQPA